VRRLAGAWLVPDDHSSSLIPNVEFLDEGSKYQNRGKHRDAAPAPKFDRLEKGCSCLEDEDPDLLHLDTHFCMVDHHLALGCVEKLSPELLTLLQKLQIEVLPVTLSEVATLGRNVLALGGRRVVSSGSAPRVDELLRRRDFVVQAVKLDEFTQCGGGAHCLTMPLARKSPELPIRG